MKTTSTRWILRGLPSSRLLLLLMWLLIHENTRAQQIPSLPFTKNYTTEEYLSGTQSWDIALDRNNVIYFANLNGLLEFDGTNWRTYDVTNHTKVRSLHIANDGKIYAGAQNEFGYFAPNEMGKLIYTSLSDSLDNSKNINDVWRVIEYQKAIYFCAFTGLYKYDGQEVKHLTTDEEIAFTFKADNHIYTAIPDQGIATLFNDELTLVSGSDFFAEHKLNIADIVKYKNGHLLIATIGDGLYFKEGNEFKKWQIPANAVLQDKSISKLLQLSTGELIVGTSNNGLYVIDELGNIKYHLSKDRGLNSRTILSLLEDSYGNVWVGLNNGIARIEMSSPFSVINEHIGIQGTGYCALLKDHDLYLGTNNGVFYADTRQNYASSKLSLIPNTKGQVYSLASNNGEVLVGHHEGATIIKNGEAKRIGQEDGAWKFLNPIQDENTLLEGNYNGFYRYIFKNDSWQFDGHIDGLAESSRVFEQMRDGTIWMTHGYKGVYKLKLADDLKSFKEVKFYNIQNGFKYNELINVYHIEGEQIFTSQSGIYRYNPSSDSFEHHPKYAKTLGTDIAIRHIKSDPLGNIYLIAADSTAVLQKNRFGEYNIESKIFNKMHLLLNDDLDNISILDHKNILFAAKEGFILYDPTRPTKMLKPINAMIRSISLSKTDSTIFFGKANETKQQVVPTIDYNQNALSFEYSCTYPEEAKFKQYRYQLYGYDLEWSNWSEKTTKEYTNLREGDYEFRIQAINVYGVESNITKYQFSVSAPWYRTTWAYSGYVLVLFGIIGTLLFGQRSRYKKENRELKLTQERELLRKDNEMEEFSKKSEAEIITLRNEKLKLEVNTKNKELATSTMNLINKNKFLSEIKKELSDIQNNKTRPDSKIKGMIKQIDKNMAGDHEWDHFQQYFDEVHGNFSSRIKEAYPDLTPQEMKLSAYLRMNLSTKEIAQLLNITVRGVEIARYRLRKRLSLSRDENLTEFILAF